MYVFGHLCLSSLESSFFFFFFNVAVSGLSCGTQALSLQHAGFSLGVAHGLQSTRAQ